jgi:hypothetical protein
MFCITVPNLTVTSRHPMLRYVALPKLYSKRLHGTEPYRYLIAHHFTVPNLDKTILDNTKPDLYVASWSDAIQLLHVEFTTSVIFKILI